MLSGLSQSDAHNTLSKGFALHNRSASTGVPSSEIEWRMVRGRDFEDEPLGREQLPTQPLKFIATEENKIVGQGGHLASLPNLVARNNRRSPSIADLCTSPGLVSDWIRIRFRRATVPRDTWQRCQNQNRDHHLDPEPIALRELAQAHRSPSARREHDDRLIRGRLPIWVATSRNAPRVRR